GLDGSLTLTRRCSFRTVGVTEPNSVRDFYSILAPSSNRTDRKPAGYAGTGELAGFPAAEQRPLAAHDKSADVRERERAAGAVPRPDAVVEAEQRTCEEQWVGRRQRLLLHAAHEKGRPGSLVVAPACADVLACGLRARRPAAGVEPPLLGEEHLVLEDVRRREVEARVEQRSQRPVPVGFGSDDAVEPL